MKTFLARLEDKIASMEKHFDDDARRNASLNKFLYEYEVNSQVTYGTMKEGSLIQPTSSEGDSMLFCSNANQELRK